MEGWTGPSLRTVPVFRKRQRLSGGDENNFVHSEGFRMYKVLIWAVKTEIVGIAPALGRP